MNIADLVILGNFNVDCNSRSFSRTKLKRLMNLHNLTLLNMCMYFKNSLFIHGLTPSQRQCVKLFH